MAKKKGSQITTKLKDKNKWRGVNKKEKRNN